MLPWLLVGVFLLLLTLAGLRWFTTASPGSVLRVLRWTAVIAGGALLLLVVLGAARQLLALALPLLLPLLAQIPNWLRRMRPPEGAGSGKVSTIETRFLRMQLDHDSGAMEGTVLEGELKGRRLSELALEDLLRLWVACRVEDEQSADVLEAYLDRVHGPDWRDAARAEGQAGREGTSAGARETGAGEHRAGSGRAGSMSAEEARAILGVGPDAGVEEIRAAHRRLMQQMHPDRGGSDYLAAKINEARQVLLGQ